MVISRLKICSPLILAVLSGVNTSESVDFKYRFWGVMEGLQDNASTGLPEESRLVLSCLDFVE